MAGVLGALLGYIPTLQPSAFVSKRLRRILNPTVVILTPVDASNIGLSAESGCEDGLLKLLT